MFSFAWVFGRKLLSVEAEAVSWDRGVFCFLFFSPFFFYRLLLSVGVGRREALEAGRSKGGITGAPNLS